MRVVRGHQVDRDLRLPGAHVHREHRGGQVLGEPERLALVGPGLGRRRDGWQVVGVLDLDGAALLGAVLLDEVVDFGAVAELGAVGLEGGDDVDGRLRTGGPGPDLLALAPPGAGDGFADLAERVGGAGHDEAAGELEPNGGLRHGDRW